ILGNIGLNAVKFCKDFNDFTKDLPEYFLLKTIITVFEDRSFKIAVCLPSTGSIISLLKFERIVKVSGKKRVENCILLRSVVQLAKFKFPYLSLNFSVPIICGSVLSAGLKIVIDNSECI